MHITDDAHDDNTEALPADCFNDCALCGFHDFPYSMLVTCCKVYQGVIGHGNSEHWQQKTVKLIKVNLGYLNHQNEKTRKSRDVSGTFTGTND